ncbi:hypothetical protein EIP91_000706 [Steccherinum ochraceum]|uniref:Uncharacterized protein n=1 Tax=Steccherinum ochraceum TaxID=92696 RepID=A0A4R0RSY9_9APHY|nr:hypothetical protein EIP91_000706 [Steccherinum ochraceum]
MHDDSDEEEFIYPGVSSSNTSQELPAAPPAEPQLETGPHEEEFIYPGASPAEEIAPETNPLQVTDQSIQQPEPEAGPSFRPIPVAAIESVPVHSTPPKPQPTPAQLETIHAAATSGDLKSLQSRFEEIRTAGGFEAFALANDASPRTGLTALHAASSRGHLHIVKWLVEECGAIPDIEDREGETALHKAALHGHLPIIVYLLPGRADVHAQDADGWTALHNACSKGYLDIVRWLCETGGAAAELSGARGVDIRSKGGWTPLMNAASKGHLPVVLYLLTKQSADPLVRNNWGETAYDAAAAVFEVWICEILQKAESERWRGTTVPYNSLAVHTTVPLVLYEYQRLDMRLKTLAMSGGKPKFSASGLGKRGHRAPFELKLPQADDSGRKLIPAWRSDVQLPLREQPLVLPSPSNREQPAREGAERSHFWLSDWTLDVTHPGVDAELGWQYAHSFDDSDDQWTSQPSDQLERLLSGAGAVSAGLNSPSRRSSSGSSRSGQGSRPNSMGSQHWVRRRRWVRVLRRRLDIPPMPFLQPDGMMYHLDSDGILIPFVDEDEDFDQDQGQEMGSMPTTGLSSAQDYVARARYLAGSPYEDSDSSSRDSSGVDVRRAIAKLERATTELRQGILGDSDPDRKTQAEVLLKAYSRDLERRRMAASAQGLLIFGDGEDNFDEDESDDEEFHYPGTSPLETLRAPSIMSNTTDYFGRASSSRGPTDLTPHLSQASEFRVPTHEAPQKVMTPRWTAPTPHQLHAQWERDDAVTQCRDCHRRFTFINRRRPMQHRVCQGCYEEVTATVPNGLQSPVVNSMERIFIDQRRLSIPSPSGETSSQISDLAECPVCNTSLADIGPPYMQEAHVKNCLEGGSGTSPQAAKYLVYKLPAESTLIGTDFHNSCLSSWLQRGRSCPVHAR